MAKIMLTNKRISTRIERFAANETFHPSEKFIRTSRQRLESSAKYAEFSPYHNGKNIPSKNYRTWIQTRMTSRI